MKLDDLTVRELRLICDAGQKLFSPPDANPAEASSFPTLQTTPKIPDSEQEYVVLRPGMKGAGVWAGYLVRRHGNEAELRQARRIWRWRGAASLAELAERGTSNPKECMFPAPMGCIQHLDVVEVLLCTDAGRRSIQEVETWTR